MPATEELRIIISSFFDSKGFKNATTQMKALASSSRRFGGLRVFERLKDFGRQAVAVKEANSQLAKYNAVVGKTGTSLRYLSGEKAGKIIRGDDFRKLSETIAEDMVAGRFDKIRKSAEKVKEPIEKTATSFRDFAKESTQAFEAKKFQVFLDQNKRLKQFGFQVKNSGEVVNKFGKQLSGIEKKALIAPQSAADFEVFNKKLYQSRNLLRKVGLGTKVFRQEFKMHLLSVMFFGMQLQRVFSRIARTSLDTFMKVTESSTEAGQGINMLQGAFATLKFAVGEAIAETLLPSIPGIMDFIMWVVELIGKNKKLTAIVIGLGLAFGSAFFSIGQLGLGIQGLSKLFGPLTNLSKGSSKGIKNVGASAGKAVPKLNNLKSTLSTLAKIGIIVIGLTLALYYGKKMVSAIKKGDIINAVKNALATSLGVAVAAGVVAAWAGAGLATAAGVGALVFSVAGILLVTISGKLAFSKKIEDLPEEAKRRAVARFLVKQGIIQAEEDMTEWQYKTHMALAFLTPGLGDELGKEIGVLARERITKSFYDEVEEMFGTRTLADAKIYSRLKELSTELNNLVSKGFKLEEIEVQKPELLKELKEFISFVPYEGRPLLRGLGLAEFLEYADISVSKADALNKKLGETVQTIQNFSEYEAVSFINEADVEQLKNLKKEVDDLIPSLDRFSAILIGEKETGREGGTSGLLTSFQTLKIKMMEVGNFIVDTFVGQIGNSQRALKNDAEAAYLATYWQAYYNLAKQGEITSVPAFNG